MKLLSADVFRHHQNGRPVVNGFASYISAADPVLMLCTGFEDFSDGYDDFSTSVSRDNGRTWSDSVPWLSGRNLEGGRLRYAEPAAIFDPDTDRLIVLVDENFYPDDTLDVDSVCQVALNIYDPAADTWSGLQSLDLAPGRSLAVSFTFPLKTSRGELLFPAMRPVLGDDDKPLHYQGCWAPVDESLTIIGQYEPDGSLRWKTGQPVPVDPERTSRGLDENTLAELPDGRLAKSLFGPPTSKV